MKLSPFRDGWLLTLAKVLLLAWAVGLAVASWQLDGWRQQLTRTLLQLNADARFRASVQQREAVDPEWYRRKALALLSATERLQHDTTWTMFMPGSWHAFDKLEEQIQARITREFGDIVVETIRRELLARASRLTGVPLAPGSGDLQADAPCESPVPRIVERKAAAAEELPEFIAVTQYVEGVERLDEAVQSFLALQYAGGQPDQLRKLVAFTLGTELPGQLAQSVRLFQGSDEVNLQPALMQNRLQWVTRCSLAKAMGALHTRLLNSNDLFTLEQALAERSAGLFDPASRALPFERTVERYRAVHELLDDQHAMLAKGSTAWMRSGTQQLGPSYQQLLKRIGATRLLGPEMVAQLENQSGTAFAEFRRQFESAFNSQGEPGIVWVEAEQRYALSPERAALRDGLGVLLKQPFMEPDAAPATREHAAPSLAVVSDQARSLAEARTRFATESLPLFPATARPVVARLVDTRVSELIFQKASASLKSALPPDVSSPLDPASFKRQREEVLALQRLLRETGAPALGDRLVGTLDGELQRRLAVIEKDWRDQPLYDSRASDFHWWNGEPMALAQALGPADAAGATAAVSRAATRLELLGQQAKTLLALGGPGLAAAPGARRWVRLADEQDRYRGKQAGSSLVRLEKYLSGLGSDLRRENCTERLAAQAPGSTHDDDVGVRLLEIHQALLARCTELRAQGGVPAGAGVGAGAGAGGAVAPAAVAPAGVAPAAVVPAAGVPAPVVPASAAAGPVGATTAAAAPAAVPAAVPASIPTAPP